MGPGGADTLRLQMEVTARTQKSAEHFSERLTFLSANPIRFLQDLFVALDHAGLPPSERPEGLWLYVVDGPRRSPIVEQSIRLESAFNMSDSMTFIAVSACLGSLTLVC